MMLNNKMLKSSVQVSLVLLGGSLTACTTSDGARKPARGETRYDYYSRQDCVKDWGETQCPAHTSSGGLGMYYYYRREANARAKHTTHAVKITRGGFGGRSSGTS